MRPKKTREQRSPSKKLLSTAISNMGRAVVLAQTAEFLLNCLLIMTHLPEDKSINNLTVEQLEAESAKMRKRTLWQLEKRLKKFVGGNHTPFAFLESFVEQRNILVHRMTNEFGATLDTDEGLQKANRLATMVIKSACIVIVFAFRANKKLLPTWQQKADQIRKNFDSNAVSDSIDQLFRRTVHPISDAQKQKIFNDLQFNWRNPTNDEWSTSSLSCRKNIATVAAARLENLAKTDHILPDFSEPDKAKISNK